MASLRITRADILSPEAQLLIAALNRELDARYPEQGANHFRLEPDEVSASRGAFFIGVEDEAPVACGALRLLDANTGEVKRMYVVPAARRRGHAARLLAALEAHARALGARRLVLETGDRQPESLALYRRFGFADIERFGEYVDSPLSVCLGKELAPSAP